MGQTRYRTVALSALLSTSTVLAWCPSSSPWSAGRASCSSLSVGGTSPWTSSRTKTGRLNTCVKAQQVLIVDCTIPYAWASTSRVRKDKGWPMSLNRMIATASLLSISTACIYQSAFARDLCSSTAVTATGYCCISCLCHAIQQ